MTIPLFFENIPCAEPPWTKLGKRLESAVRKALFDFKLIERVSKLGVALSGGKDSLTLLFLLKAISGRGFPPFEIYAIHVSGAFSCGAGVNTSYLQNICNRLGVPFIEREAKQSLETLECYSCSRERRRLLFDAAKSVGVETIAFGHHRDDSAQTLLMNLLHKGEFAGNLPKVPMHDYGVTIIRPLIYLSENDIRTFAEQQGFKRIMCRCPVGQNSMRRKVDDLLREIEQLYPEARENIARAGLLYGSDKALRK
jgi:tRNA 2-thiocytidine biosynthesis protein TtcA